MWNLWLRSYLSSASGLRIGTRTSLRTYLPPLLRLSLLPDPFILLCPRVSYSYTFGTGMSTCCPSPTPLGLGLGPDLPWVDEPSPGNLGLSTGMFLACLSLLIPAFSLVQCPPCLSIRLLPLHIAPLPRIFFRCTHRFGVTFSPGHLRRTITRPVSYYALFKCVAASEPTSWLSVQFHILLHLT